MPVQTISVLLGCFSQLRTKYYFPNHKIFHFISLHRLAIWACSHAGSPVSVSLGPAEKLLSAHPYQADPCIYSISPIKTKDDVTVILLLGVSFMLMRNECDHKETLKGTA